MSANYYYFDDFYPQFWDELSLEFKNAELVLFPFRLSLQSGGFVMNQERNAQ